MPLLEQGRIAEVAENAHIVAGAMQEWIGKGYDVIALVPSCALMLKFEWPLILPDDKDVAALSKATYDISEYVVDIARKEGLAPGVAGFAWRRFTAHGLSCARAEHGAEGGGDAAPAARRRCRGDRAMLWPRRILGIQEGKFRNRA